MREILNERAVRQPCTESLISWKFQIFFVTLHLDKYLYLRDVYKIYEL